MTNTEPVKSSIVDPPPTVWGVYNDKARFRDKVLLKDWDSSINSLLLFAAIFAAVLTALCVESRKLLEPDPLGLIDQTLVYMLQRSIDPSIEPPPPRGSFEPPKWAVIVNAFFFTSLTTSILAAVGAVTCLQWVEEYDAGVEAAATPKERAIRSHYRYRATERWYMRHMIASLPIILYLAVGFFFIGLMLWFWQIYWVLAFIPLAGLSIWVTGYTATTLMAVFCPSAPYRTAVSKALFRVIYLGQFYAWDYTRTTFSLYRPLLKFLRHFFSQDPWNESRNQYILEKIEFSRVRKSKLLEYLPWILPGRDVHQSMHSHIREQGSVARDETIHISTLAWLASSIDLSEDSAPKLYQVLEELNDLPESKLRHWPDHNYDAPWSDIFKMVLAACVTTKKQQDTLLRQGKVIQDGGALHHDRVIPTLAKILQKMSLHPTLFERMIHDDLDSRVLINFMDLLKSKRPTSSTNAKRRLESITLLVSSKKWTSMPHEEQPIMPIFKVILDCLDSMQTSDGDPHISTSWVFTFCYVKKVKVEDDRVEVTWPKPALLKFIPDAFTNKNLREHAIILVLHYIDAILCDTAPTTSTKWRWKWSENFHSKVLNSIIEANRGVDNSVVEKLTAKKLADDKLVVMKLLVNHLLRIFFTFSESQESQRLFNDLVSTDKGDPSTEKITNPALRLIVMALGGHQEEVEVPPKNDALWHDPVWQYAVSVWFGFQTDYAVSNGHRIFELVSPAQSARLIDVMRKEDPVILNRLIVLSTGSRSSKNARFWNRIFALIPQSELQISRRLSSHTAGLCPEQWLQLFADFQSHEGPCTPTPITSAMLQALQGSFRFALCRSLWKYRAQSAVEDEAKAPLQGTTTPLEKLIQLVTEVWRIERPYRQAGSLPLGILELTRDTILHHRNNPNFQRLQLCVCIVDELALAYTTGSRRDQHYTQLFLDISISLRPICTHLIARPSGPTIWSEKLKTALKNTSCAGGREIDATQAPLDSGVEIYTPPSSPVKEWVLQRIRSRTATFDMGNKV